MSCLRLPLLTGICGVFLAACRSQYPVAETAWDHPPLPEQAFVLPKTGVPDTSELSPRQVSFNRQQLHQAKHLWLSAQRERAEGDVDGCISALVAASNRLNSISPSQPLVQRRQAMISQQLSQIYAAQQN